VYSAGYGLKQSGDNNRSYMQLIDSTTAQDFEEWKNSVVAYGYREVFANSIEDNLYVSYEGALGTLYYAEFRSDLGQVKVISDAASTALDEFCYTLESNDHPEFYMLKTAGGEDDLFLIHASDDSWIVIDGGLGDGYGGVMEQRGHDIFAFMEKRSQMINGKLVISAWYCSHAHRDHFTGFLSVLKLHSEQIDLQRVILNTPDPQIDVITNTPHLENNKQLSEFMPLVELISAQYPDVKVLKAHTGMKIQIADIFFTILHTQEDLLEKWYANEASWNLTDYNSSSLVSMIEMDDIKILMMGDNFRPDLTINHYSMKTTLACNLFKVGHHYINVHADDWYRALYNTCKFQYAIVTHNGLRQTGDYLKSQLKENFILQSFDITYSFSFDGEKIVCNQYED
jgi:glyoxylase-like metal-dependent hydrolase (beta-lactamase superfamily II)